MKTVPLPWSARSSHLAGIPRRVVFTTVGTLSKLVTSFLNNTHVHNLDTLLQLVRDRPPGTALLTVSNHACTIDDPLMWGIKGFPMDPKLARWTLTAKDICFTNPVFSYFFRLGKCIPITRGAGIYQPHMNEALERLNDGDWLHTFPEGKISQENGPIGRLKWGTASLIARATVPPIVLPVCHSGFEKAFAYMGYVMSNANVATKLMFVSGCCMVVPIASLLILIMSIMDEQSTASFRMADEL